MAELEANRKLLARKLQLTSDRLSAEALTVITSDKPLAKRNDFIPNRCFGFEA